MNKPRLIDANELIGALRESHKHHANNSKEESLLMRDIAIVNEMPIAYDIDKVVEQLEGKIEHELIYSPDGVNVVGAKHHYDIDIFEAIEIVRKGGVNNDNVD